MQNVEEQKKKLEQKKHRLSIEETKLKLKERKARTRHLIENGGLITKAILALFIEKCILITNMHQYSEKI